MMERRLRNQLGDLESALRRARLWRRLARCWLATAALCVFLFLIHEVTGWNSRQVWALPLTIGAHGCRLYLEERERHDAADFSNLVSVLEREHPELRHLLSAAAEQRPDPESGEFNFLQLRLINEVLTHRQQYLWEENIQRKLFSASALHAGALALFVIALLTCHGFTVRHRLLAAPVIDEEIAVTLVETPRLSAAPVWSSRRVLVASRPQKQRWSSCPPRAKPNACRSNGISLIRFLARA